MEKQRLNSMILMKEMIDSSVERARVLKEKEKKIWIDQIHDKIEPLEAMVNHIGDLVDTYLYAKDKDENLGTFVWHLLTHEDKPLKLDFCNALFHEGVLRYRCGVRLSYDAGKGYSTNVYVSGTGLYFCPKNWEDGLYNFRKVGELLPEKNYGSTLAAMNYLIETIPVYKDNIMKKINERLVNYGQSR